MYIPGAAAWLVCLGDDFGFIARISGVGTGDGAWSPTSPFPRSPSLLTDLVDSYGVLTVSSGGCAGANLVTHEHGR